MIEWLPVVGYEATYEVSWTGEVRSKPRPGTSGKTLAQHTDRWHYQKVTLNKDGEARSHSVHTLVAKAWIGPRPEGLEVRHLDGDPSNNEVANLVYGTKSENAQDRLRHGHHDQANKTHCPQGHPYDEENTARSPEGKRYCKACKREKTRARRLRLIAAA